MGDSLWESTRFIWGPHHGKVAGLVKPTEWPLRLNAPIGVKSHHWRDPPHNGFPFWVGNSRLVGLDFRSERQSESNTTRRA